jgi:phosphate-selective porin OprO/OprP
MASDLATIVIEDVVIFDREGQDDDERVNLVVKEGLLSLVTKDGLPDETKGPVFDAKKGVLLGGLEIGKPASFMVVDESPRDDIRILLDTETHAVFAIADGVVLRNRLRSVPATERSNLPTTWFSYTPPPFTLPVDYRSTERWNQFNIGKSQHLFTGALALDRTRWQNQDTNNVLQVGELDDFDQAELRALRFGLFGVLDVKGKPWTYTIAGATNAFSQGFDTREINDYTFFDVRVDVPIGHTTLSLGKQKEPQSMERTMGLVFLPFQERSMAADALMPSRNTGLVLSGTAFSERTTWAGGLFNDWLDTGGSRSESASQVMARLTAIPLVSADTSNLLHIGVGYRHSNSKEGFTTGATPEVDSAPEFLDTGPLFPADDMVTWNYELGWRKGPYWLMAEYTSSDLTDTPYGDLHFAGYNIAASWIISGEMRPYNHKSGAFRPIPIANPVSAGGSGAWELGLRYSTLDLSDKSLEGGEASVITLALNWWLQSNMMFGVNLQRVELDRPAQGTMSPILTGKATAITSRIVLILD